MTGQQCAYAFRRKRHSALRRFAPLGKTNVLMTLSVTVPSHISQLLYNVHDAVDIRTILISIRTVSCTSVRGVSSSRDFVFGVPKRSTRSAVRRGLTRQPTHGCSLSARRPRPLVGVPRHWYHFATLLSRTVRYLRDQPVVTIRVAVSRIRIMSGRR